MQIPSKPANEIARVNYLKQLNILDTGPEERFDRITRLAKHLFNVPIALVSLVDSDRQWFKSNQGLNICESSRDISFCAHAILNDEIMVIENAVEDKRFFDIDKFKEINDVYGHTEGDNALKLFSEILLSTFRERGGRKI